MHLDDRRKMWIKLKHIKLNSKLYLAICHDTLKAWLSVTHKSKQAHNMYSLDGWVWFPVYISVHDLLPARMPWYTKSMVASYPTCTSKAYMIEFDFRLLIYQYITHYLPIRHDTPKAWPPVTPKSNQAHNICLRLLVECDFWSQIYWYITVTAYFKQTQGHPVKHTITRYQAQSACMRCSG